MAATVGDVILGARELMTDLPQSIAAPMLTSPVAVSVTAANAFPVGTWFFVATLTNTWGETLASNEVTLTVGVNQTPQFTFGFPGGVALIVGMRVYFGPSAGSENQYVSFTAAQLAGTTIVTLPAPIGTVQAPPGRSTAYLPDSDGQALGAYAIYRLLNQALGWAAAKNRGGLPDFGAVGTTNGQPNYVMPGYWKKIDSAWFDGYPLGLLAKNNVFRRNPVPGYSGMLIVFQATDRLMVEAWPQPNRTSGRTVLTVAMTSTDTVANVVSTAGYVLGFGMTQIGNEIINFAGINGNQLIGLTRGMCGTVPSAQTPSTIVTELNLMIAGYRVPANYSVGSAATALYLPPGWDEALISYILYRFRSMEQDESSAQRYLKEATQKMSDLGANRIIAGPRQISPYSNIGPETVGGMGSAFGGVILP